MVVKLPSEKGLKFLLKPINKLFRAVRVTRLPREMPIILASSFFPPRGKCASGTKLPALFILLSSVMLFTGCVVGPDFSNSGTHVLQPNYVAKQRMGQTFEIGLSQWWQSFNDPKLNSLLHRAQEQNLSLRESYHRIAEARARVHLRGGQLKPNGDLVAEYSYRKNSQNARPFVGQNGIAFNLFDLGLDASWELDLFGKIKRSIEEADAELEFEQHDYQFIKQTLFADIVSSYLNIRLLQAQESLIQKSLSIQSETSVLVAERLKAGVSTELDRSQTQSFQHRTRALLASVRQQVEIEFNRLGMLMGQSPDNTLRGFVGLHPLPAMPAVPEVGMPAELLGRRPDVLRDEMAVKAASARIGIAEADLYPQISLLGTIAVSAQNISSLFETEGLDFTVGPSLRWNILHFNRINDNINIQHSVFQQALAKYHNTVLSAAREVEDAFVNHQGYLEQWNALKLAINSDRSAVELSLQRYQAGKANFQRVLDAQQQLLDDQRQSYVAQTQAIAQLVRLYRAAGGGWELNSGTGSYAAPAGPVQIHSAPVVANIAPSTSGSQTHISNVVPGAGQPVVPTGQPVVPTGQPVVPTGQPMVIPRYPISGEIAPLPLQPPSPISLDLSQFEDP